VRKELIFIACCLLSVPSRADDADSPSSLSSPARLHIGGFADAVLHSSNNNAVRHLVELDLFSTLQFSESWSALAEGLGQRTWRPTEAGEKPKIEIDLERFYVTYRTSDVFRVEIGQTHTGIVRWNEREHRSRFLQTPIEVPAIARRPQDEGAWPLRFVGVWASGRARGSLGLTWEVGAGAGPGLERDAIPIFSQDRSPAGFVAVSVAPENIPGLDAGISVYAQHVPTKPDALRERDITLFSNYVNNGTEIRAEFARMEHHFTRLPKTFRNQGYYVLLSKRLAGSAEHARPYVLLDHLNMDAADPYLTTSISENAWAAGVRYDFTQRFTMKGEYRSQRARDGSRQSIFGFQLGVSF
jgi:hypothetical protein